MKQPIKRSSDGPQNPNCFTSEGKQLQNSLDLCQHECYQSVMFKSPLCMDGNV